MPLLTPRTKTGERYKQRTEWAAYHDEPCPEVELTQFPKPLKEGLADG